MKIIISALLLCLLAPPALADYKLLYDPDQGNKVIGATWPNGTLTAQGNEVLVTGIVGDIPRDITRFYKYVDSQLVNTNAGQQFILTVDDDELLANGTSWTTVRVTLADSNGDPIDDDTTTVTFSASRGRLASLNETLLDGTASVTITSISETVSSDITAETGTISGTVFSLQATGAVDFVP